MLKQRPASLPLVGHGADRRKLRAQVPTYERKDQVKKMHICKSLPYLKFLKLYSH